jgi:hypothetical protein
MLEGLMPEDQLAAFDPALVSPALLALAADDAPTKTVLCAGAGSFEVAHMTLTRGAHFGAGDDVGEKILDRLNQLTDATDQLVPASGAEQGTLELTKAGFALRKG